MREFSGKAKWVIWCIAAALTLFQLYTEATVSWPDFAQRAMHICLAFTLIFLLYPVAKGKKSGRFLILDIIICLGIIAFSTRHIITGWEIIPPQALAMPGARDLVFGTLLILTALEATRRTLGMPLVIVALIFIAYAFLGAYVPGVLGHQGITPEFFISYNYLSDLGMLGSLAGMSAGIIFAVVAFGGFMLTFGGGDLLIKVSMALAGQFRGGPAKVAVVGSALFGTISGSPTANIVSVGVFTIPMMKRLGYRPEFAAAVEATASTGGQIMPPVMAVAAFVMAEFLQIPYNKLIVYATIPAIFYFVTIFMQVHLEAVKNDLKPLPLQERVRLRDIPLIDWILVLPIAVFIYYLVGLQYGVTPSALYATVSVWVCFAIHELVSKRRLDLKRLVLSLEAPAKMMLPIVAALITLGVIMYAIDLSGLATKLSTVLVELAGNNLWLLMFLTMLASLILGTGLPTVACYIFLAVVAAPSLIQMGVLPIAAHMFVFYFGIISAVTPPVCIASFVAAAVAGAPAMKTAVQATKLAIAGFLVPYMFVMSPALLAQGPLLLIAFECLRLGVAAFALAIVVEGCALRPVGWPLRLAFAAVTGLIIYTGWVTNVIGFGLFTLMLLGQWFVMRRAKVVRLADHT